MILFEEIEKCFPVLEKHYEEEMYERWEIRGEYSASRDTREFLRCLLMDEYLFKGSELYSLFRRAGVAEPYYMAEHILQWFYFYLRINQKDISSVLS